MASKVPKFGAWESEEDTGYTVRFETVRKGNPGGPIINPNDVIQPNQPKPKPKQKQPEFGAWEDKEQEEVSYTQYFELQGKAKASPPREPEINYNMGTKVQPSSGSEYKRPVNAGESRATRQGVKFVERNNNAGGRGAHMATRQRPQATAGPSPNRGGGGSVPAFGDWNTNPSQAEGYTIVFKNLQDEKKNGGVSSVNTTPSPSSYSASQKEPKQGTCCPWF